MFQGYVGKFLESMLEKLGSISIDVLFCKASRVFFSFREFHDKSTIIPPCLTYLTRTCSVFHH